MDQEVVLVFLEVEQVQEDIEHLILRVVQKNQEDQIMHQEQLNLNQY